MLTANRVLELDHLCYPANPLNSSQLNAIIHHPNWVIRLHPSGQGYAIVEGVGDKAIIRRVGVEPGARRERVASSLIQPLSIYHCQCELREDNLPGLKLMQSQGFKTVGIERGKWGRGVDGIKMERVKL